MSLKAKQHGLFNAQFISALKTKRYALSIKYIILFVSLLFSLNSFAVSDIDASNVDISKDNILSCDDYHTWREYHRLHKIIKKNLNELYNLAKVSLCLGEAEEGMDHLQKASDKGHIAATLALSDYYKRNQTFSSTEETNNLENLNKAIYYHKRGISMIEELPNYPKGASDDMEYIEYHGPTSVYLFTGLPFLYLRMYMAALENMINGHKEEVFYNDTLTVLSKMGEAAINCLERPALDVWKEKKEIIYESQQLECSVYLELAEAVYILEQQRIEADQNCQVPLKECAEHKKVVDKMYQVGKDLQPQLTLAHKKFNSILSDL